jgi:uncharacterized protein (TIGR03435 family)
MKCLVVAGLMTFTVPAAFAQAGGTPSAPSSSLANASYVPTMTFDVASVRENKDIDPHTGFTVDGDFVSHTTTFRATNWDIENLITFAYGVDRYQLVSLPKWPWPTMFVIEAKGEGSADAKFATLTSEQQATERRHMIQVLLEQRFNLKTHWDTREGDIYNLVVARSGPKLRAEGSAPPSPEELKVGERPAPPLYQKNDGQGYDFVAHGCSMSELVATLTGQFGRPVIDRTQLTGKYDFVLRYKGRWDRDRDASDLDPMPPLDRALQEELGLKLESSKGLIKVLVIDRITKPSEN